MIDKKGLYQKYTVSKMDKSPIDPNAKYVVLRYDEDTPYCWDTRTAIRHLAYFIRGYAPKFSKDLIKEMDRADIAIGMRWKAGKK